MENNKANQNEKEEGIQDAEVITVDTNQTSSKTTLIWVAVLFLLCLQAGSFWLWSQQKSLNDELNSQLSQVMSSVSDSSDWGQSLKAADVTLTKRLSTLDEQQASLSESLKEVSASQQITRGDIEHYWALSEVEYLLNVANQRVLLAKDAKGAHQALVIADARIEALSDYRLHPLRALLAEEQLALSSVMTVDVNGMVVQLESALKRVDNLQVLMASPVLIDKDADEVNSESWQGTIDQAWQEVKSLVVIRHQQDAAAAVLVPEQRYFLYQNMKLKLETARLALLSGQVAVFESSLDSAAKWLEQYFIGDDKDALSAVVSELQSAQVERDFPDISASLNWVKGFER